MRLSCSDGALVGAAEGVVDVMLKEADVAVRLTDQDFVCAAGLRVEGPEVGVEVQHEQIPVAADTKVAARIAGAGYLRKDSPGCLARPRGKVLMQTQN